MDIDRQSLKRELEVSSGHASVLVRLLRDANRRGELQLALHDHREKILAIFPKNLDREETPIAPEELDVYLHEFCPEINLEAEYNARLAELAACKVTHLDVQGRPCIRAINGQEYPAPTLEEIKKRITVEKICRMSTLPAPRILILTPFGMSLKELAEKVTSIPGNFPEGQHGIGRGFDLDADLPGRDENELKLFYYPKRFDPLNHGGLSKTEMLNEPWSVVIGQMRFSYHEMKRPGQKGYLDSFKDAHEYLREYQDKGWDGLRPEDHLALHAHGVQTGRHYDDIFTIRLLGAYLTNVKKSMTGAVPASCWHHVDPALILSWIKPEARNDLVASRAAVRL